MMGRFLIFTIILFTNSNMAYSANNLMNGYLNGKYEPSGLVNLILSLVFVIFLIYISGWIYQKLSYMNSKKIFQKIDLKTKNKPILLSGLSLGQNRNLHVVEVNNRIFLIGATPNNISLIKEITEENNIKNEIKNITENNINDEIIDNLFEKNDNIEKIQEENNEYKKICEKYL